MSINLSFIQLSKSWYKDLIDKGDSIDEITIKVYDDDICLGDFIIKWTLLSNKVTPRLLAYDDSWKALFASQKLTKLLSDLNDSYISSDVLADKLISIGAVDMTETTKQY